MAQQQRRHEETQSHLTSTETQPPEDTQGDDMGQTSTREQYTTEQRDTLHGPTGYTTVEPVPGSDGPRSQMELDEKNAQQ